VSALLNISNLIEPCVKVQDFCKSNSGLVDFKRVFSVPVTGFWSNIEFYNCCGLESRHVNNYSLQRGVGYSHGYNLPRVGTLNRLSDAKSQVMVWKYIKNYHMFPSGYM
jgi:hypothetical protein